MPTDSEPEQHNKQYSMEQSDAVAFHLRPDSKPVSKGVQQVSLQSDRVGWAKISDSIRKYDEEKASDVKEDIDVLLVLAGLFSAVATSFVLDSYSRLQQIRNGPTNDFFAQMSLQLLHMNRMAGLVDSSLELPTSSPPQLDTMSSISATRINILWSSSLVISLLTASFGMLVKQWIRAYMALETNSPIIRLRIRFFREDGLATYQVWEIAALLPILLQTAFLLFLIGFAEFVLENNPMLGWIVVAMMIIWLFAIIITSIIPFFSAQCPYKSPLWIAYRKVFVRSVLRPFWWIYFVITPIPTHLHSFNWLVPRTARRRAAVTPTQESTTPSDSDGQRHRNASDMEHGTSEEGSHQASTWSCGRIHNMVLNPLQRIFSRWGNLVIRFARHRLGLLVGHFEEHRILKSSSSDIAILARAQKLLLDQELSDHIRRCAEGITLLEATEYMKKRLRMSPFQRDCKAMKPGADDQTSPVDRRWHASYPQGADQFLYGVLSYALDAHFKLKFKEEIVRWKMLAPDPVTKSRGSQFSGIDESSKAYIQSLGRFWKFRVVYESLTYVTLFACFSKPRKLSRTQRAVQGDIMHFSWLAQSFPHLAINFIQLGSSITGVCFFMSLYSIIGGHGTTYIYNQLRDSVLEFGEKQEREKKKASEREIRQKTANQESRQMDVHFVSEISEGEEGLRQDTDECMNAEYIIKLMQIYDVFHSTPGKSSTSNKPTASEPSTSNELQSPASHEISTSNKEPSASGSDQGWEEAKEALDECFEEYGWSPREENKLKVHYTFLILLHLVPSSQRASLAREAGSRLGELLEGIKECIVKGLDCWDYAIAEAAEELMDGMKEFTAQEASAQAREGSVSESP